MIDFPLKKENFLGFLLIFLISLFVGFCFYQQSLLFPKLKVTFFDIQGESSLIQLPGGIDILIDGGEENDLCYELEKELPFFDKKVDYIFLSHPEKDHLEGLFCVLDFYEVDEIFIGDFPQKSFLFEKFLKKAKKEGVKVEKLSAGDMIEFPFGGKIFVLWPSQKCIFDNFNDCSLVFLFLFGKEKILFTGDISERVEKILEFNYGFKVDLLKVAHHGSKYSSSPDFLKKFSPQMAVIIASKNDEYHPSQRVIETFKREKIKTFIIKKDGKIKFFSYGDSLEIVSP